MAWKLCSKENVLNIQPIPKSELEDSWSEVVEALIRQHLGTPYLGSTQIITGEKHNGDGTPYMRVKSPPIYAVSAIRINGASLLATEFVVHNNYIQLVYETFPRGNLNVEIVYTSGSTNIGPVTKLAASSMIVAIFNYKKRFGADASIKWSNPDKEKGESIQVLIFASIPDKIDSPFPGRKSNRSNIMNSIILSLYTSNHEFQSPAYRR